MSIIIIVRNTERTDAGNQEKYQKNDAATNTAAILRINVTAGEGVLLIPNNSIVFILIIIHWVCMVPIIVMMMMI